MQKCPSCKSKLPIIKLMGLTGYNSITCPKCGVRIIANKRRCKVLNISVVVITWVNLFLIEKSDFEMLKIMLIVVIVAIESYLLIRFNKLEVYKNE